MQALTTASPFTKANHRLVCNTQRYLEKVHDTTGTDFEVVHAALSGFVQLARFSDLNLHMVPLVPTVNRYIEALDSARVRFTSPISELRRLEIDQIARLIQDESRADAPLDRDKVAQYARTILHMVSREWTSPMFTTLIREEVGKVIALSGPFPVSAIEAIALLPEWDRGRLD